MSTTYDALVGFGRLVRLSEFATHTDRHALRDVLAAELEAAEAAVIGSCRATRWHDAAMRAALARDLAALAGEIAEHLRKAAGLMAGVRHDADALLAAGAITETEARGLQSTAPAALLAAITDTAAALREGN